MCGYVLAVRTPCVNCMCVFVYASVCVSFCGHMHLSDRVCVCVLALRVDNDPVQRLRNLPRRLLGSSISRLQWQPNQSSADPLCCIRRRNSTEMNQNTHFSLFCFNDFISHGKKQMPNDHITIQNPNRYYNPR